MNLKRKLNLFVITLLCVHFVSHDHDILCFTVLNLVVVLLPVYQSYVDTAEDLHQDTSGALVQFHSRVQ